MSGIRKVRVICFDYYMTLVKLNEPFQQIENWIREYLLRKYPNVDCQKFIGLFTRNRARLTGRGFFYSGTDLLVKSLGMTCNNFLLVDTYFIDTFIQYVKWLFSSHPVVYSDCRDVLEALRKKYTVGLLTNADNSIIGESLRLQKLTFDFVITSEDAKCNKPGEGIFKYAFRKLEKGKDEMIMIGDSQIDDIYGAGCMGIKTIWVNRNKENLKEGIELPLFTVDKLMDIPNLLEC